MRNVEILQAPDNTEQPIRIILLRLEWQGPNASPNRVIHDILEVKKITPKYAEMIRKWIVG